MKKDVEQQINAVFKAREEKAQHAHEVYQEKEDKATEFLQRFLAHRASVIKPALASIADYLRTKGVDSRIEEADDPHSQQAASITIFLPVATRDRSERPSTDKQPHLTVICDKHAQLVRFHESTMSPTSSGHAGGAGEAKLEDVTEDLVHQKVLTVVKDVFGR
jgi:hypothetical protein